MYANPFEVWADVAIDTGDLFEALCELWRAHLECWIAL